MELENNKNIIQDEATDSVDKAVKVKSRRATVSVISLILTLAGWMLLPFVYQASIACGVGGFITGIIGWRGRRGGWRNLAITCMVAAFVLLLVFATFWGAILYLW